MAEQTETYANIVSGVEALAGDSLTSTELSRLKSLINHRARVAYRLYDEWPEFTVTKDQRQVRGDGGVNDVVEGYGGADAGENHVDTWSGFYESEPFDRMTAPTFEHYEQSGKAYPVGYEPTYDPDIALSFNYLQRAAFTLLMSTTTNHNLEVGDKFKISGATFTGDNAPDPNIEHVVASVSNANALYVDLTSDGFSGVEVYGISDAVLQLPHIWCSYTTRLADTYGDGDGETATVPRRWADYLIRATYADFLRSDGQAEKAAIEDALAQEVLDREIYMLDRANSLQGPRVRVHTHASR